MDKMRSLFRLDLPLLPVLVSALAIILSQLPPAYSFFQKAKFSVELGTQAQLFDNWGSLIFQPYVLLHNSGTDNGLVNHIDLFVSGPDNSTYSDLLPVQTYFEKLQVIAPTAQAPQVPARLLRIGAGEVWASYVSAWKQPSSARQDKIAEFIELAEDDFNSNNVEGKGWLMDSELLADIKEASNVELDRLMPGRYTVLISAVGSNGDVMSSQGYYFHLRSSHIKTLKSKLDEYQFGGGVIFPLRQNKFFGAWVEVNPITGSETLRYLKERYARAKET